MNNTSDSTFTLTFDFKPGRNYPYSFFEAVSETIKVVQEMDQSIIEVIRPEYENILLLEDVYAQSPIRIGIKSFFKNIIARDDELIVDKEVNDYLAEANLSIIEFTKNRSTISDLNELIPLEQQLYYKKSQSAPSLEQLLGYQRSLQKSTQKLAKGDTVRYSISNKPNRTAYLNKEFFVDEDEYQELTSTNVRVSESERKLVVKKPDLTGFSQWDFRIDPKTIIKASISDFEFLNAMHDKGNVSFSSGDSIIATLKTTTKYDKNGRIIGHPTYDIIRIKEVIHREPFEQLELDDDLHEEY